MLHHHGQSPNISFCYQDSVSWPSWVRHSATCPWPNVPPSRTVHPQNDQLPNVQLQNVQLPNVQLQNIQDTKRPGYKTSSYQTSSYRTSRIQNVQDTKHPGQPPNISFYYQVSVSWPSWVRPCATCPWPNVPPSRTIP
jgi:hypothetical protein